MKKKEMLSELKTQYSKMHAECHKVALDAECHYAECRHTECRGAFSGYSLVKQLAWSVPKKENVFVTLTDIKSGKML